MFGRVRGQEDVAQRESDGGIGDVISGGDSDVGSENSARVSSVGTWSARFSAVDLDDVGQWES